MTEIELFGYINPRRDLPQATCDIISKVYEILQRERGISRWHIIKDEDFPTRRGLYLCCRYWNYRKSYDLIHFDGEYWVTGGMPEDRIIAWCEIPELPKEIEQ